MHLSHCPNSRGTQILLVAAWGTICSLIIAAPLLAMHSRHAAASVIYFCFSFICHQIPERSFMISGCSLAVCQRCSGIYLGLLLGSFFEMRALHGRPGARRILVLSAAGLLLVDALAPAIGLWIGTATVRFSTGLLFGTAISWLLVRGFSEFLREAPWLRLTMPLSQLKGDLS